MRIITAKKPTIQNRNYKFAFHSPLNPFQLEDVRIAALVPIEAVVVEVDNNGSFLYHWTWYETEIE